MFGLIKAAEGENIPTVTVINRSELLTSHTLIIKQYYYKSVKRTELGVPKL